MYELPLVYDSTGLELAVGDTVELPDLECSGIIRGFLQIPHLGQYEMRVEVEVHHGCLLVPAGTLVRPLPLRLSLTGISKIAATHAQSYKLTRDAYAGFTQSAADICEEFSEDDEY